MGRKWDAAESAMSVTAKLLVSLLWVALCIVGFASGVWELGLVAIAYLAYLWLFGGRWLFY